MEKLGRIIHPKDAKVFMDEQEAILAYEVPFIQI